MSTTLRRSRRPPRDPSAAIRPKSALERAALQSLAFRQKVQQANATSICNSTNVGRMPMRQLLAMDQFCVPIFQRRYCWTERQWTTLLEDAVGAAGSRQPHSLGRLTCTTNRNSSSHNNNQWVGVPGRSCILDGQQRFTSTTLLLAAIRDLLQKLQGEGNAFADSIQSINQRLFWDLTALLEWEQQKQEPEFLMEEGTELPFARLVPTFCDRRAYYAAILPACSEDSTPPGQPLLATAPLHAKQFFLDQLQENYNTLPQLTKILRGVLDGLTMLYFPVDSSANNNDGDGTEDWMVIYERLALRDATFCRPTRKDEYQSMDGSDMIRNMLLGSFASEKEALEFYQKYWLPLEQLVADHPGGVKSVLQSFLDFQTNRKGGEHDSYGVVPDGGAGITIGGPIYVDFQTWFATRLSDSSSGNDSVEEKVHQVGKDLSCFAQTIMATKKEEQESSDPVQQKNTSRSQLSATSG